ncbi:MAG: cytochrome d ubiquinol oxidase subunit II [Sediminicola sp.]
MLYVVLFFLLFSLLLYILLGGADFGAGIVELFSGNRKGTRDTIYGVIGPVWEANHIWLIILMVILWTAFPLYFNVLIVYLHIPLTLILLGITLRGVAFVFRHYDAVVGSSQFWYNWLFRIGSFVTPVFLGMTFAALVGGEIIITESYADHSFYQLFISNWFNPFCLFVGLFYAALCAFLASSFLIGETEGAMQRLYKAYSARYTVILVVLGFFLILYGYVNQIQFIRDFIHNPASIILVVVSGILLYPLWRSIANGNVLANRILAGIQVVLIVLAALLAHFPNIIIAKQGEMDLLEGMASGPTMDTLGISLLIGGVFILPGLFHLMKSFDMIKILKRRDDGSSNG